MCMDSLTTEVSGRVRLNGGEIRKMRTRTIIGILLIAIFALSIGVVAEGSLGSAIHIDVAPNTLNLESNGNGVTVHTNIAYADVDCRTVALEVEGSAIAIRSCYSDLCGDLVVKVDRDDVTGVVSPDYATFKLTGETIPNENGDLMTFEGVDTIRVIDVAADGSKK